MNTEEQSSKAVWKVVSGGQHHYCSSRDEAEAKAAHNGGVVLGYVPGVGWTVATKIARE